MLTPSEESAYRMSSFIIKIIPKLQQLKPWLNEDQVSQEAFTSILEEFKRIVECLLSDDGQQFTAASMIRSHWFKIKPEVLRDKMKTIWSEDESVGRMINSIYSGRRKLI